MSIWKNKINSSLWNKSITILTFIVETSVSINYFLSNPIIFTTFLLKLQFVNIVFHVNSPYMNPIWSYEETMCLLITMLTRRNKRRWNKFIIFSLKGEGFKLHESQMTMMIQWCTLVSSPLTSKIHPVWLYYWVMSRRIDGSDKKERWRQNFHLNLLGKF